jgi:hypothetical protein
VGWVVQYCPELESLGLAGCDITDGALTKLLDPVHSGDNQIAPTNTVTDTSASSSKLLCDKLQFLNLSATTISDYGLDLLTNYFPHLIALNLSECSIITFVAVKKLIEEAPSLQALCITRCDKLTLENLYMLRDLKPDLFIDKHPELMDIFAPHPWRGYQIVMDEEMEDSHSTDYGDDHYQHHDAHETIQQNQYDDNWYALSSSSDQEEGRESE